MPILKGVNCRAGEGRGFPTSSKTTSDETPKLFTTEKKDRPVACSRLKGWGKGHAKILIRRLTHQDGPGGCLPFGRKKKKKRVRASSRDTAAKGEKKKKTQVAQSLEGWMSTFRKTEKRSFGQKGGRLQCADQKRREKEYVFGTKIPLPGKKKNDSSTKDGPFRG